MRQGIILFLALGLGLTASCDYSSYRKSKDAEKGKMESSTQENSIESSTQENSMESSTQENSMGNSSADENK